MSLAAYFDKNPSAKRHIWLVSMTYPFIPLMGVGLMMLTGNVHMAWAPLVFIYIIMPIIERLAGNEMMTKIFWVSITKWSNSHRFISLWSMRRFL